MLAFKFSIGLTMQMKTVWYGWKHQGGKKLVSGHWVWKSLEKYSGFSGAHMYIDDTLLLRSRDGVYKHNIFSIRWAHIPIMKNPDATVGFCHFKPEYWGGSMPHLIHCLCMLWFQSDLKEIFMIWTWGWKKQTNSKPKRLTWSGIWAWLKCSVNTLVMYCPWRML